MSDIDTKLRELLNKDELPFEADLSIQQRLNYHLQIKIASSEVKQNSVAAYLNEILSTKFIGWKVSILSIAFFILIGYRQINNNTSIYINNDTTNISKPVDTLGFYSTDDTVKIN